MYLKAKLQTFTVNAISLCIISERINIGSYVRIVYMLKLIDLPVTTRHATIRLRMAATL